MRDILLKYLISIIAILLIIPSFAQSKTKSKDQILIEGNLDLNTSQIITNKLKEVKDKNEKLESEIILLNDKLISKYKDRIFLDITLSLNSDVQKPHFGILQLNGDMNAIPVIKYENPLILEANDEFALFQGEIPIGSYEFRLQGIVGQQFEKWPFVLPEGNWNIEKIIKIDATKINQRKKIQIKIVSDEKTGIPLFEIENEEKK